MLCGGRRDGEGPYRVERGDVAQICNGDCSVGCCCLLEVQLQYRLYRWSSGGVAWGAARPGDDDGSIGKSRAPAQLLA
jgi:hypothetical protein